MNNLIKNWPKLSFMIISKLYWVVGFFYTIWVIQGEIPSAKQFLLGSIYTIATLPLNYWLTYDFGPKKGD